MAKAETIRGINNTKSRIIAQRKYGIIAGEIRKKARANQPLTLGPKMQVLEAYRKNKNINDAYEKAKEINNIISKRIGKQVEVYTEEMVNKWIAEDVAKENKSNESREDDYGR